MGFIRFRSINFNQHFIRHRDFMGELTTLDPRLPDDFAFEVIPRGEQGEVALRSKNFPDRFLRHRDFRIRLEGPNAPNPQLLKQDSTFVMEKGIAGSGVSFRSVNFRTRFIRHRDFDLFLEEATTNPKTFAADATFFMEGLPVSFGDDNVGIPVEE